MTKKKISLYEQQLMLKELLSEYRRIMTATVLEKETTEKSIKKIKETATELRDAGTYQFAVDGTNEELFISIAEFTHKFM